MNLNFQFMFICNIPVTVSYIIMKRYYLFQATLI